MGYSLTCRSGTRGSMAMLAESLQLAVLGIKGPDGTAASQADVTVCPDVELRT